MAETPMEEAVQAFRERIAALEAENERLRDRLMDIDLKHSCSSRLDVQHILDDVRALLTDDDWKRRLAALREAR